MSTTPLRWRDTPRERLSRHVGWDRWLIVTVGLWVVALAHLYYAVTGTGPGPRPESVLVALLCGAGAAWMSWIAVLFLQRPAIHEDGVSPAEQRAGELRQTGYATRAEHDRRAWRSR